MLSLFKTANLYKWGLILVVWLATVAGAYYYGMWSERIDVANRAALAAQERVEYIVEQVEIRVPVVQERDAKSQELRNDVSQHGTQLNEAINKRTDNPACALSDDELRHFNALAEATHN